MYIFPPKCIVSGCVTQSVGAIFKFHTSFIDPFTLIHADKNQTP